MQTKYDHATRDLKLPILRTPADLMSRCGTSYRGCRVDVKRVDGLVLVRCVRDDMLRSMDQIAWTEWIVEGRCPNKEAFESLKQALKRLADAAGWFDPDAVS